MTSGVNERPYLSIGEVLGLLLEEFPDVTISKIRFLESQGLIEPERTASGYRKFFDADVERLREILRQQREHFLPLRVIRDRLNGATDDSGSIESPAAPTPARGLRNVRVVADPTAASFSAPVAGGRAPRRADTLSDAGGPALASNVHAADPVVPVDAPPVDPSADPDAARRVLGQDVVRADPTVDDIATSRHPAAQGRPGLARPAVDIAPPAQVAAPEPVADADSAGARERTVGTTGARPAAAMGELYLRADVCSSCGVTDQQLGDLESFGLVAPRGNGSGATYTESDLAIVRAAAGFLAHGIDARHLRGWRQAADREASLFEQRILPLLRQRNPQARHDAAGLLRELADLGGQLREAIVLAALRHHLEP